MDVTNLVQRIEMLMIEVMSRREVDLGNKQDCAAFVLKMCEKAYCLPEQIVRLEKVALISLYSALVESLAELEFEQM